VCRLQRGKDEFKFFEEECCESVWSSYDESEM